MKGNSSPLNVIRTGLAALNLGAADLPDNEIRPFAAGIFQTYSIDLPERRILAKVVTPAVGEAELDGLLALAKAGALVPEQYGLFPSGADAVLFMELVDAGRPDPSLFLRGMYSDRAAGEFFGYNQDNFIGSLSQTNARYAPFSTFWWESRIEPQCRMACASGLLGPEDARLAERMVRRRAESWHLDQSKPRLIHGDLWNGNVLFNQNGESILIDPSVAYGHPEQDLAMLELFGSPVPQSALDLAAANCGLLPDRQERSGFFQLYPLLVHVNLFGAGYVSGVRRVLRQYE